MTAVNWMIDALLKRHSGSLGKEYIKIFEQAKEMEKQQIIDAANTLLYRGTGPADDAAEQYYNETYGSNVNFKQFSLYEHKETITSVDIITSSQTEISDEEIERAFTVETSVQTTIYKGEIAGAKWYREQLKKKQ